MSLNLTPVQLDDICHKLETGRLITQEEAKDMYCDLVNFHNRQVVLDPPPITRGTVRARAYPNLPRIN